MSDTDFEAVRNFEITIPTGSSSATGTFMLTPVNDSMDEEDETVSVTGTSAGLTVAGTKITILDDDVEVSLGESTYTVAEGAGVAVKVTLSADPERSVTIPLTKAEQGGASGADYSGVPARVVFASGETSKTFTFAAAADDVDGDGEVDSPLTGLYSYAAFRLTDQLTLWATSGYGEGDLTLRLANETLRTDMAMTLVAAGARGDFVDRGEDAGRMIALEADGMFVRTTSDAIAGMVASQVSSSRQRIRLEGSWDIVLEDGVRLTPGLEAGVRHDAGDAESGFGVRVGGGFDFANPAAGLRGEMSGSWLLAHEHDDFREWGLAGTLHFDSVPDSNLGLSNSLAAIRRSSPFSTPDHPHWVTVDTLCPGNSPRNLRGSDSSSRIRMHLQRFSCRLQGCDCLRTVDSGEIEQKLLQGLTGLQIIEEILHGNAGAGEYRHTTLNARMLVNRLLFHVSSRQHGVLTPKVTGIYLEFASRALPQPR